MANRTKLWIGLGTMVLAGAGTPLRVEALMASTSRLSLERYGPAARAVPPGVPLVQAQAGEADEGGEAGEVGHGAGAVAGDSGLFLQLMMMKAHLAVGFRLLEAGEAAQAAKHFRQPLDEHYSVIRGALEARGVEGFGEEIEHLAADAANGEAAEARERAGEVLSHLEAATHSIDPLRRGSPDFLVPAVYDLLEAAAHEYGDAIAGGAFKEVDEYQDAYGFVLVARDLLGSVAAELYARDPERLRSALVEFDKLMVAWPAAAPPDKPVLTAAAVLAQVSRIELALGSYGAPAEGGEGGEPDEGGQGGETG